MIVVAPQRAAADTISLAWDASTDSTVVGYMVHVGNQTGTYTQHLDVGLSTAFAYTSAVAGQQYCFAVTSYTSGRVEGPTSNEVCGYSNQPPVLVNPGARVSTLGLSTTLQLQGSDPEGQPVSYSASGLPPGLTVMASTGFISGTPTTAGSYTVTATVSDGVLRSSQTFGWSISSSVSSGGGGSDTSPPSITITGPTSADSYTTTASTITLSGTASDNVGVTQITWANDRGGGGTASGTSNWSVTVALAAGTNRIIVTARDAAGHDASDVITVTSSSSTGSTGSTGGGGSGLLGEYFSGLNLNTSITTRVDPVIDFGWNYGSPAANVPSDGFSVRWTGQIVAPVTGTYSFTTMSDDGVRLWIGNQLMVDNWTDHGPTVDAAPAVALQAGQSYAVRLEYYDRWSYSIVQLRWSYPGQSTQVIPQSALSTTSSSTPTSSGLQAEYYSDANFGSLVTRRTDPSINFSWGYGGAISGMAGDNFSVRWSGALVAPVSGMYTFSTVSDDGVRFALSDQLVIDNWSDHGPTTNTSSAVWLDAGQRYTVRLDYYERTGWSVIQLQWTVPGQGTEVIPASAFVQ